jgi:uncharacterized protein YcbK (DUF882 family)
VTIIQLILNNQKYDTKEKQENTAHQNHQTDVKILKKINKNTQDTIEITKIKKINKDTITDFPKNRTKKIIIKIMKNLIKINFLKIMIH